MTLYTVRIANGGMEIDSTGSQTLLSGPSKVAQDIVESTLEALDPINGLGTELFDDNGQLLPAISVPGVGREIVHTYIQRSIRRLMVAQAGQEDLPEDEKIEGIRNLVVTEGNSQLEFLFFLDIELAAGDLKRAYRVLLAQMGSPVIDSVGGLATS